MNYGRYQILEELGRGSMGIVYKAHDPQIDRMIALKVLRQDRLTSEAFVQRFLKEAKAIGRLSHPNIVTVYDVGEDHETVYIAMEFLEGTPLHEVMKEKRLTHKGIVDLCVQVAETLDYAHQKGIVHRDIKPTNIILTPSGQAKITDFGIAHIEDTSMAQQTQAGEILGTPVYMSPEQVMSRPVDGRSDLYSLGVILYELTTGRMPFRGDSLAAIFKAITQETPPEPAIADSSISRGLSELVMKSLNKAPDERFQTGKAMAEALKACLVAGEAKVLPQQPVKKKSKLRGLLVVITLIVIGLAGSLSYYFMADKRPQEQIPSALPDLPSSAQIAGSALLNVESMPPGALVFLDDSFRGKTPLNLELALGKYEIRLSLSHYYEWEAQVQLEEEGETPLFVRLVPVDETN